MERLAWDLSANPTSPRGRGRARSVRVRGARLADKFDPLTLALSPWERGRTVL